MQYLDDYFYFQYKMSWKCIEPTTSKTFCYTVDWQLFITSKLQPNEISGFQLSAKCVSLQSFRGWIALITEDLIQTVIRQQADSSCLDLGSVPVDLAA